MRPSRSRKRRQSDEIVSAASRQRPQLRDKWVVNGATIADQHLPFSAAYMYLWILMSDAWRPLRSGGGCWSGPRSRVLPIRRAARFPAPRDEKCIDSSRPQSTRPISLFFRAVPPAIGQWDGRAECREAVARQHGRPLSTHPYASVDRPCTDRDISIRCSDVFISFTMMVESHNTTTQQKIHKKGRKKTP